jgi:hypothetical protein
MNCFRKYLLWVWGLGLITACAQLPEYAQPRRAQFEEPRSILRNGFPYRALTPEDFRAASVPDELSAHAERINAHSAIQIRLSADSSVGITHGLLFGQNYFFGRIFHLAFEAVMLPERSWWNPKIQGEMRDYVLQHEQIHFALTELAARKLSRDSQGWAAEVLVIKPTLREVEAELAQQVNHMIGAAMEANLKRHAEFDEDTSLFFNPRRQQWWSRVVEEELQQAGPASR